MSRQVHLGNDKQLGCKTASRHIGGYVAVELAEFNALPEERKCQRCLNGRVFALWTKNATRSER